MAQKIDFAVVGPDDPLVMGAVDRLHEAGIPCFGPEAKAAIIEGSKVFAKNLMKKYAIPTAEYAVLTRRKRRWNTWPLRNIRPLLRRMGWRWVRA